MNWRNTLVLLVISVGAAIFVWRVGREWESPDGTESEGRIFKGFKDARPKIDRIEFDRREADSKVDLMKKGEEHWELTHPIAYRADPWRARGLLSALEFLKSENVLTGTAEKPLDLEEYGLGEGFEKAVTVNLYAGEEKLYGIRFGDVTTDEEKVYAAVEGRDEVYVVKKHALEDFTKKVAHYRSTKVVFFESAEVSKLVVRKAGADPVEMVKEGGIWKMSAPIADRGSYDAVRGLLDLIEGLNAAKFLEKDPEDLAAKGLKPAKMSVSVFTGVDFDEQTILFGGPEQAGDTYCMRQGSPYLLTVLDKDVEKIKTDPAEYRDTKLANVKTDEVQKLTVVRGTEELAIKRKGVSWDITSPAEHEADTDTVNETLQLIKDAEIKEFLDPATKFTPALTVRLERIKEGEIEEFELARPDPESDTTLARRKAGAGVYGVPSTLYADLSRPVLAFRSRLVLEFTRGDARSIERAGPGEQKVAVIRGSSDEPWAVEGRLEEKVDLSAVDDILWRMSNLTAEELVGEFDKRELARFGLDAPELTVTVKAVPKEGDEKLHTLRVGRAAEGEDYHGIIEGSKMVFTVSGGLVDALKHPVFKVEDKGPAEEKPEEKEPGKPAAGEKPEEKKPQASKAEEPGPTEKKADEEPGEPVPGEGPAH